MIIFVVQVQLSEIPSEERQAVGGFPAKNDGHVWHQILDEISRRPQAGDRRHQSHCHDPSL